MTEHAQDHCPNCIQFGLPILPLRYAVARNDETISTKAPPLSAPFGAGVEDIELPKSVARYTLRLLRAGYLYVFNEVRGEWKAYEVSEHSELMEFDIRDKSPPPNTGEGEPRIVCSRHGGVPLAKCVIIPDAAEAGAVWLAFTDTAWTAEVFDRHRQQSYRARHMRRIDVGAWVADAGSVTQPHLDSLTAVSTRVSDYHLGSATSDDPDEVVVTRHRAFLHSLHDLCPLAHEAETLLADTERAGEQWGYPPAMVALGDPVGVTMDLASLTGSTLQGFLSAQIEARPLAVSTAIGNLRNMIHEDAENRQIYRSEREARQMLDPGFGGGPGASGARAGMALAEALNPALAERRAEAFERWRNPSAAQLAQARADGWRKYERKLDNARLTAWEQGWNARVSGFDREVTLPLANAHVAWMQSAPLREHFDCNHDDADMHSGQGFVDSMLLCVQDTQEYRPCAQLYTQWLSATRTEQDNLLLRALGYNQKAVIDRLDEVVAGGLAPGALRGLPWDGLIDGYDKALEALGDGGKNAVVRLTASLGGPLGQVAGAAVDGVVGPAMVAWGVIAKAPVIQVEVTMSKARAIAELTARMTSLNPKVGDLPELNRAIDIQMRKAGIFGVPVNETGQFRYLIMADPRVVEDFPGVDAQGRARRFAETALLTESDHHRMTRLRWRQLLPGTAALGIATGVLQVVALGKLAEDLDRSMAHEHNENQWRYGSGVAALAGTLAETTGRWSESAAGAANRSARFIERYVGRALRFVGKALGIGAGVVMAVWDVYRGVSEVQEGNGWVGIGFVVSGAASALAVVAFTKVGALLFGVAASGVGIILVVAVLVIAILIEVFKDNKLQDWLERCHFGKFAAKDRYDDPGVEIEQLNVALAG